MGRFLTAKNLEHLLTRPERITPGSIKVNIPLASLNGTKTMGCLGQAFPEVVLVSQVVFNVEDAQTRQWHEFAFLSQIALAESLTLGHTSLDSLSQGFVAHIAQPLNFLVFLLVAHRL